MSNYRASFDDPSDWQSTGPGVRSKLVHQGPVKLRLLEMTDSASHPEWCEVGHAGIVVEGVLEIEFDASVVRYDVGEAIVIPQGRAHRHRPKALTARVRLALVDYPGR